MLLQDLVNKFKQNVSDGILEKTGKKLLSHLADFDN